MSTADQLNYRVFDTYGDLIGATVHAEDAARLVSLGGTVKAGRTVVWTEGAECIEAADSYDQAGNIMLLRREIALAPGPAHVEYRASLRAELDQRVAVASREDVQETEGT